MKPVPQVRGSAYLPFVEFLDTAGVTADCGIERELVPAILHRDGEALVPMHLAHGFLARAAGKLGQEDFGVLVGRKLGVQNLGSFGRSLCRSLSLHDALTKLYASFPHYSSAERIWWRHDGHNIAFFLHSYLYKTSFGSRYARDTALLLMRDMIRLAAGPRWQPNVVLLTDLENTRSLSDEFGAPEIRQSNVSGFSFPVDLLCLPLRHADDRAGEAKVETRGETAPSSDFVGSLKQVIATCLPEGWYGLEQVAAALGTHPRTLQRKLSALELEYSEVLSQVRFDKTLRLLADPSIRVQDVALELGFQGPSNFARSFRQWTGVTPSEFRKTNQNRR